MNKEYIETVVIEPEQEISITNKRGIYMLRNTNGHVAICAFGAGSNNIVSIAEGVSIGVNGTQIKARIEGYILTLTNVSSTSLTVTIKTISI